MKGILGFRVQDSGGYFLGAHERDLGLERLDPEP